MSATIVDHDHIDALLTFASSEPNNPVTYIIHSVGVEITHHNATEIGRILLTENERSVRHRYPNVTPDDLPGLTIEENGQAALYEFKPWVMELSPLWILKACDCFDYQASETDDYAASIAHKIVMAIRMRAIGRLPGYENCPGWELIRDRAETSTRK